MWPGHYIELTIMPHLGIHQGSQVSLDLFSWLFLPIVL